MREFLVAAASLTAVVQSNAATQVDASLKFDAQVYQGHSYNVVSTAGQLTQINVLDLHQTKWLDEQGGVVATLARAFTDAHNHLSQYASAKEIREFIEAVARAGLGLNANDNYVPHMNGYSGNKRILLVKYDGNEYYVDALGTTIVDCINCLQRRISAQERQRAVQQANAGGQ